MKTSKLNQKPTTNLSLGLKTLTLAAGAAFFMTGCLTKAEESSFKSDGQGAFMTAEIDQMGQVFPTTGSGAAKSNSGEATITSELVIDSLAYHDDCKCFVRHAKLTTSEGYERDRVDSITLLDSANNTLSKFEPKLISHISHIRNVVKTKGGNESNVHIAFTVDIKTNAGVKVGVTNGTMTGSYNGQQFKSGTITNVHRDWENGRFRFPTSGTIEVDRPAFHFMVDFLGDGRAKVAVKNKLNSKIHTLFVDTNYNESDPQEQP